MQLKMIRDKQSHHKQPSIWPNTESNVDSVIKTSALDVEYSHIMLVRIALNLRDMQKQGNVDFVVQSLLNRKKLREVKTLLAMSA